MQRTPLEWKPKAGFQVVSTPLVTIPNEVKLKDVDDNGNLIIDDEKKVVECVQNKISVTRAEVKEETLANQGILSRKESGLKYDVYFHGDKIAHIYPGDVGEGSYGKVNLCFYNSAWHVVKFTSPEFENEFSISKMMGLAVDQIHFQDQIVLLLKWLPGITLEYLLDHMGAIPPMQKYKLTQVMVNGQSSMHAMNVVHGDYKPGNLMWSGGFSVTAFDFGKSEPIKPSCTTVTLNPIGATPDYSAPELFMQMGKKGCAIKVDDFALGMTLAEMHSFFNPLFDEKRFNLDACITWGFKDRLIKENSAEFKAHSLQPLESRGKLLKILTGLTQNDPASRLDLKKCEAEVDALYQASRKDPITKAIVDVDEAFVLINSNKYEFHRLLRMFDMVLLAESKKHTVKQYSQLARFFMSQEIGFVNVWPHVFSGSENDCLLDVVSGIPGNIAASDCDSAAFYFFVSASCRHAVIPAIDCNIVTVHPRISSDMLYSNRNRLFSCLTALPGASPHVYVPKR